jgi:hypothetical protein
MLNSRSLLKAAYLIALAVAVDAAQEEREPKNAAAVAEFERLVHCGTGFRLVVYENGEALQQVEDTCLRPRSYSRRYKLTANELDALRAAIREAEFQELPEEIQAETVFPDEDAFRISVPSEGTAKRVLARGLDRASSGEARRFRMVWDAMARIVPEPGPDEK